MKHKYTTTFSSVLKPLVSEEKDKYLALASLVEVGNFIPNVDTEKNIDLLPVAFNAAVVNRVNKNGDVIDAETAVAMYENFINKPINLEHNRERIFGVILTAGFSEFGTDAPLSSEQVKNLKTPFNITLGGVLWKIANPSLAEAIEDSSDTSSDNYQKISASWELGFSEYDLVVIEGESKNIEDGQEISEQEKIDSMKSKLRAFGGSGKVDEDTFIYRKVIGNVIPLGIGLTETPAADVKGVATNAVLATTETETIEEENVASEENISNSEKTNVNNINKDQKSMKITSINDITDENLKEISASQIAELIEQELKDASEKFAAEKGAVDSALKAAEEKYETLVSSQQSLKEEMESLKEALKASQEEIQKAAAAELFNARMSGFDSEYELDDKVRKIIANEIVNLDEEAFAAYKEKMSVFLKIKSEAVEVEAKTEEAQASAEEVVEEVTEKAEKEVVDVPMTSTASEETIYEKYKTAFNYDGFVVS
jgi:hypothetical protein